MVWYGMVWYGMVWYGVSITINTEKTVTSTNASSATKAKSKDAKIKLEPTVATCGYVDGSTPMVWYGKVWHGIVWYGANTLIRTT